MLKYILLQMKYHGPDSGEWLMSTFWTFYLHIQKTSAWYRLDMVAKQR